MASDFAVDLVFEGFQRATRGSGKAFGWKERYYCSTTSVDTALAFANANSTGPNTNLSLLRRGFLDPSWRISYFVATDLRNPNVTKVASPTGLNGMSPAILNPAQVQCAVAATLYRLPAGGDTETHRRNLALRGVNSALINGNVLNTDGLDFAAVVAFLNLVGRQDGSLTLQLTPAPPTQFWQIAYQNPQLVGSPITALALLAGNPNFLTITAAGLGNVVRGDRVTISGVTNLRGVNKTWRVMQDALAGTDILLGRSKYALDVGAAPGIATAVARKKGVLINPAHQYVIRGVSVRKTGRPINPLRGRSSARRP